MVENVQNQPSIFTTPFLFVGLSEIGILLIVNKLKVTKNNLLIKNQEQNKGQSITSVDEAKVFLLQNYFECSQDNFSTMAEEINRMVNIGDTYSNVTSNIEKLFSFIYNKDSHTRVLTLFVLLCSMITILLVNSGQSFDNLIAVFYEFNATSLIWGYFIILVLVIVLGVGIVQVYKVLEKLLEFITLFVTIQHNKA